MKSEAFAVVLVFARLTTNAACPDPNWQIYTDHTYRVTVCIPPGWEPSAAYKDRPYFRASDGSSFQFDAADGNRPQLVCEGASTHPLRQFGHHPIIRALKIDGQTACLVVRSKNEGGGAPHAEAQIVVKYPRPVKIVTPIDQPAPVKSIEGMYGELILNGDEKYILEIAKTLRFMRSKQP